MPNLIRGRIVYSRVDLLDSEGRIDKSERKYIVVNSDKSIKNGDDLRLVPISGKCFEGQECVPLSWSNPGIRSNGGLTKPCFAVCTWNPGRLEQQYAQVSEHFVTPKEMWQILEILNRLGQI